MENWFLEEISIEGFRGINNEGSPFALKFDPNKISSISALNAVGKSSIYDAISFVIKGMVPRLEELHAGENGKSYYINRFFAGDPAQIKIKFREQPSGTVRTLEVCLHKNGTKTINSPDHGDPKGFVALLNREFVLLDYPTIQRFVENSPLDRGRAFSRLIGLSKYAELRSRLRTISNTNAFNRYFETTKLEQKIAASESRRGESRVVAYKTAAEIGNVEIGKIESDEFAASVVFDYLGSLEVLKSVELGESLKTVDFDLCYDAIKKAEGGSDKDEYVRLSQISMNLKAKKFGAVDAELIVSLHNKANDYETALANTAGAIRQSLLVQSKKVIQSDGWENPDLCPTCEETKDVSLVDFIDERLKQYALADEIAEDFQQGWNAIDWAPIKELELALLKEGEEAKFSAADAKMKQICLSTDMTNELKAWYESLKCRHEVQVADLDSKLEELKKELPEQLVDITKRIGESKQVKEHLLTVASAQLNLDKLATTKQKTDRIKTYLDAAAAIFADAESAASKQRVDNIIPEVQKIFGLIVSNKVIPKLEKPQSSEELKLILEKFWIDEPVNALPILSESYKNALAISIFMASASLYSGAPRFMILDDLTSSFDGGNQYHIMETIRTAIARPTIANGLQTIILSHDPLLEKYFNKASNEGNWRHQRIEGSPQTLLMASGTSGDYLRDRLLQMLDAGTIQNVDAGIRQLLECRLFEIIQGLKIRVPLTFAIDDNSKMAQNAIDAINYEMTLYLAAGSLVMTGPQQASFSTTATTTISNFLSHYATNQTGAIGENALRQTIAAIDDLRSCFQHTNASGQTLYYKALDKIN